MVIQRSLAHLKFLETSIVELEADMENYYSPYTEQLELLQTIPGVGAQTAKVIVAEIGVDMSVFPTDAHISSWVELSPRKNESAGAVAHKMLVIAYHILKTKDSYKELGADYLAKRKEVSQEEIIIKRLQRLGYSIHKPEESTTI